MNITAARRSSLIRIAGQHAKGSEERRAVLALLLQASETWTKAEFDEEVERQFKEMKVSGATGYTKALAKQDVLQMMKDEKITLAGKKAKTQRLPAEQKDIERIESMVSKSGGEPLRMNRFADAMALTIKEWMKAERRGSAASQLGYDDVAQIFWRRADALKGPSGAGATVEPSFPQGNGKRTKAYAIPMGAVNLKTGDNRVFNFIDTWGGDSQCLTIAESVDDQRKIVIVGFGGPGSGYGRGTTIQLISDQTRGELGFYAVLKDVIGPMSLDLLKEVAHASGKWTLHAYVLK